MDVAGSWLKRTATVSVVAEKAGSDCNLVGIATSRGLPG